MIELHNLCKTFGRIRAVDNVSLTIEAGSIFGFLGPNGAGKTTTIKMIVGLLKPTSGTILINGKDVARHPEEVKMLMGYIPDRSYIYEKLTAREFLQFVAGMYGITKNSCKNKIDRLLSLFGLEGWEDELIESFSHGMRQRVVIASALIHNPKVIIVDEPVVGLDPRGAKLVKTVFKKLAQTGITIFLSTHVLEIAEELCDQIAIIQKGNVIAQGTMEELQTQADTLDKRLEYLFLKLTGEDDIAETLSALQKI